MNKTKRNTCSLSNEQQARVRELFETTPYTYDQIAEQLNTTFKVIWRFVHSVYTKEQIQQRKRVNYSLMGEKNPYYKKPTSVYMGKPVADGKGYLMVLKPEWYTGRKSSHYVFQHTIVMCEALGLTELPEGFVVHHIDGDKTNNTLSNLALMTNSAHARLHCSQERATTISKESRDIMSRSAN